MTRIVKRIVLGIALVAVSAGGVMAGDPKAAGDDGPAYAANGGATAIEALAVYV